MPAEPVPGVDVEDSADSLALISSKEAHNGKSRYENALVEEICGLHFVITPLSFFQTNPAQTEKLYNIVASAAGDAPQTYATPSCLRFFATGFNAWLAFAMQLCRKLHES